MFKDRTLVPGFHAKDIFVHVAVMGDFMPVFQDRLDHGRVPFGHMSGHKKGPRNLQFAVQCQNARHRCFHAIGRFGDCRDMGSGTPVRRHRTGLTVNMPCQRHAA